MKDCYYIETIEKKYLIGLSLLIWLIFLIVRMLPYLLLGHDSYLRIGDNLDSMMMYMKLMKENEIFYIGDGTVIPNLINGIKSSYVDVDVFFNKVFLYFFTPFQVYVISSICMYSIGFFGAFLLIKDYFCKNQSVIIVFLITLIFASFTPRPLYGLEVLGQPILLWSFLNLSCGRRKIPSIIIIFLFPFYAYFASYFSGIILFYLVAGIYLTYRGNKKNNQLYWVGFLIFLLSILLINYGKIYTFLFSGIESNRLERINYPQTFGWMMHHFVLLLFKGMAFNSNMSLIPLYIIMFIAYYRVSDMRIKKNISALFLIILLLHFFCAAYPNILYLIGNDFTLLNSFSLRRIYVLLPICIFIALMYSLIHYRINKFLLISLLSFMLLSIYYYDNEFRTNWSRLFTLNKKTDLISYASFYSKDLFNDIDAHIKKPKEDYRVVSFGIHPGIATFNGFYSLDAYLPYYSLDYKHKFRKIISQELNKNEALRRYFDGWGNQLFIFNNELFTSCNVDCYKWKEKQVNNLSINTHYLKDLGAKYIFSAVKINNYQNLSLTFLKLFEDDNSIWQIYLYEII